MDCEGNCLDDADGDACDAEGARLYRWGGVQLDADATDDDGSCQQLDECGVCGGGGIPAGDCDCDGNQLDECGVCGGTGIADGDCDCDGNQLDALGVRRDCTADADADGICDDVDDCVGSYDSCGVCNGPGAIYECGCADIPEGDATATEINLTPPESVAEPAPRMQTRTASATTSTTVWVLDNCGVCNGPGAIYECGCEDIPDGDCDCDGNQLDAIGVCGGDCPGDADDDGICDTDEIPGCTDEAAAITTPTRRTRTVPVPKSMNAACGGDGIADGDCDCDGNQLDALGVAAPARRLDGDGVCDTDAILGCTIPRPATMSRKRTSTTEAVTS